MSAIFPQTLTVTEVFTLARFGEVALSGAGRLYVPTSQATPGAAANAFAAQNARSRILLDDGLNTAEHRPVRRLSAGRAVGRRTRCASATRCRRSAASSTSASRSTACSRPAPVNFTHTNPRPTAPDAVGGNLRIASLNVLNFFNGDGAGGGFPTSRGANTPFELQRQRAKEVNALATMNADIVGLMEMENDAAPNSAVADLVAGLNDKLGAGHVRVHRHRRARHRRDQGRADLQAGLGHARRRLEGADGGAGSALRHDAGTVRRSRRRSRTTRRDAS